MTAGELNGSSKHVNDAIEEEPAPAAVTELAASCVRFVASRYGVALDFLPETLPLVDQYVRDGRPDAKARPETVPLLAASVGAYLGEVMRRQFGAFWFAEGDHAAWRLYFTRAYLACNPLGMALEALSPEAAEGWHAHFEIDPADSDVVSTRLAAFPDIDADVLSLPTTRFEALTVVYEALRSNMEAQNTSDVRFGPEDYR